MAKKVSVSQYIASTNRRLNAPYNFAGGNGSPEPLSEADRLKRVEETLGVIQQVLNTQLQRMADMQVIIDRLEARKPTDSHN